MCAINPKHKKRLLFDFYTSIEMPEGKFEDDVLKWALEQEQLLNKYGIIRVHVKETTQEAL